MACKLFEEIDLINKIRTARGDDFAEGLLIGINLTTPVKSEEKRRKAQQVSWGLEVIMKLTLEECMERVDEYGNLDLRDCTSLTTLPEGLTVGGSLCLSYCTSLTTLPEGLTVGGGLDLMGCTSLADYEDFKPRKLKNGDYVSGRYIYCDGILTHIRAVKKVDNYTVYVGKIPGQNVVSDGTHYAHCDKLRDGIADLAFKTASDRGADQYRGMSLDTELTVPEAVTMYRIITGACRQGSEQFVKSLGKLKAKYTIRECLEITKGQYNADKFASFFGEE